MSETNLLHWFATLPPVIERHELKYIIPFSLVEPITEFAAPYCDYDEHSLAAADRFYEVNSLYFDSLDYRLLRERMDGVERRYNVRVRSYGDGSKGDYYAEVKYKTATSTRKFRATLRECEWPAFIQHRHDTTLLAHAIDSERRNRELFAYIAEAYAIEPKIFTCYRRRALASTIDDYARITFDTDLRCRQQDPWHSSDPYSLRRCSNCVSYDLETIFGDEQEYGGNVILELKSSIGAVPIWMLDLIRRFELKQVGFSKYMNSSLVLHQDSGQHYMSHDRLAEAMMA